MNNFKAICLSFRRFLIPYLWYNFDESLIIILDIKNSNSIFGIKPSFKFFLTKATLLGVIKI